MMTSSDDELTARAHSAAVDIRNLRVVRGGRVALDDVSVTVARGVITGMLGPSGCGKTTLMRMLAGFEVPTHGRVVIDGQDMSKVAPNKRPINMVFQSYAVFPHMSVEQNVAYGLKMDRRPAKEIRERVAEALDLVKLGSLGKRMPDEMSGGQRQRVALARALVKRPSVLLLDEPLSALDAKLREAMQLELVRLQKTVGITFVIVTHDQSEALSMANRIAVMNAGTVQQVAPPATLYEVPANRFVADFILEIDAINPQVAARLLSAFRSWRVLEPVRRAAAEAELKRIAAHTDLPRYTADIVQRSLD